MGCWPGAIRDRQGPPLRGAKYEEEVAVARQRSQPPGLTHLAGVLLAAVRLVVLLTTAAGAGRTDQFVTFGVFGCSLIAMYGSSVRYHLFPFSPTG